MSNIQGKDFEDGYAWVSLPESEYYALTEQIARLQASLEVAEALNKRLVRALRLADTLLTAEDVVKALKASGFGYQAHWRSTRISSALKAYEAVPKQRGEEANNV